MNSILLYISLEGATGFIGAIVALVGAVGTFSIYKGITTRTKAFRELSKEYQQDMLDNNRQWKEHLKENDGLNSRISDLTYKVRQLSDQLEESEKSKRKGETKYNQLAALVVAKCECHKEIFNEVNDG